MKNIAPSILALTVGAIAVLGVSTEAKAQQTRGEAFLEALWPNVPPDSGIYQLGALNNLGFQQASESLISQGLDWCNQADVPSVLEVSLGGLLYYAPDLENQPEIRLQIHLVDAAFENLCPEKHGILQQALNNLTEQ